MIQDLNDLYYFSEVVSHGGFAPAGRAINEPKSKLSRRITQLEERLGVRLIERSTRRFRVTEVGQAFYERCRNMLLEAEKAEAVVAESQGEPAGVVRFSCPTGMLDTVGPMMAGYLERYPKVRLQLLATNSAVDLIEQRVDVALRVRASLDSDASLTMRTLATSGRILVAAPVLAAQVAADEGLAAFSRFPTLAFGAQITEDVWVLHDADGAEQTLRHEPRMACGELSVLRAAATAGVGIGLLPDFYCRQELQEGKLVHLLPHLHAQPGIVHLVFTTRRGLPPAVRAFIDHLAHGFRHSDMVRELSPAA